MRRTTNRTTCSISLMSVAIATCVLALSPGGSASAQGTAQPMDAVKRTARWLARQAQELDGTRHGVAFPEYAEEPEEQPVSLYAGSAGVLVFLENAASVTRDASISKLADRTAEGLRARMTRHADGHVTWTKTTTNSGAGLYTGDAGVGHAFLVRAQLREDAGSLNIAKRVGDALIARARTNADGCSWDSNYDIIGGAAGTMLFLLDLGEATGEARYTKCGVAAGRWLAREGTREGDTIWWAPRAGTDRHYPNFSHGTSGVVYSLARAAIASNDAECRAAALAGTRWLMANVDDANDTLAWCHYLPGRETSFREGWCHGPAGTARTFLAMHAMTGDPQYRDTALASARWIVRNKPNPGPETSKTRFWAPSLCCGAAGVVDCMVDVARATGDRGCRAYAADSGAYLRRLAKPDGNGLKWTNYDHPDEDGVIYHSPSLMLGASGEALALLRLAVLDRASEPIVHLPDRRVHFGETPAAITDDRVVTEAVGEPSYIVLVQDGSPLMAAARKLAKHRDAEILRFDPANPDAILEPLIERNARYVAVVLEPTAVDVNLVRRFIVLSTRMDNDPFCDFAFGFITASSPRQVNAFVDRIIEADRDGVELSTAQWAVSNINRTYAGSSFIEGLPGDAHYVSIGDHAYAKEQIEALGNAGFVHIGGCGDPEGIWLFDDERNRHTDKHWAFEPDKVGHDPEGEMPRLMASDLKRLRFDNAVVWTHVCHIGTTSKMYVEGDIVSTFGRTEQVESYTVPRKRSVALAMIDAGVSAYIAPLGPNHGGQSNIEQAFASESGEPLGDVMRRAYHDVVMDTEGQPEKIGVYIEGKPRFWDPDEFTNFNSPHNRVLYGDPLFQPFGEHRSPATVEMETSEDGERLTATFRVADSGWLGRTAYGNRGRDPGRGRIYEAIPLEADVDVASVVAVETRGAGGGGFDIIRHTAIVEQIDGRRLLHVQLVTDDADALREAGATVTAMIALGVADAGFEQKHNAEDAAAQESAGPMTREKLDKMLDTPWSLARHERSFDAFLTFVESFINEHGETYGLSGKITFAFEPKAAAKRSETVVVEADGTTLRAMLDTMCEGLRLTYTLDGPTGTVRFDQP